MIRTTLGRLSVTALFLVFMGSLCFGSEIIIIDVSPNVLNLQSEGKVVTVHTDIAYGAVDVYTVYLNGVKISSWKADDRGFFVAKFAIGEIKDLYQDDDKECPVLSTLTLYGFDTQGETFEGSQKIMVIDNVPAGGK